MKIPANLVKAGFAAVTPSGNRSVSLVLTAHWKAGKTTFACTSPDPIAIIATDPGTRQIVEKFPHKDILLREHFVERDADQDTWREEWKKAKNSLITAASSPHIRTIVADTGTELYELLRLAEFGKLEKVPPAKYVTTNREMRELLTLLATRPDLNVIWIHKFKKEYIDKGDKGIANWTGKYESAGFSDAPFILDLAAVCRYQDAAAQEEGYFSLQVCGVTRQTAAAAGTILRSNDRDLPLCFASLAWTVYPDSDLEEWMLLAGGPPA